MNTTAAVMDTIISVDLADIWYTKKRRKASLRWMWTVPIFLRPLRSHDTARTWSTGLAPGASKNPATSGAVATMAAARIRSRMKFTVQAVPR